LAVVGLGVHLSTPPRGRAAFRASFVNSIFGRRWTGFGGARQRPPGFQAARFFRVVAKRVVARVDSDIAKRPGRADDKWSAQLSYLVKP
jgi:hypothetical protein